MMMQGPGAIEVEVISLDGVPTYRLKKYRCLYKKGYYRSLEELAADIDISTLREI